MINAIWHAVVRTSALREECKFSHVYVRLPEKVKGRIFIEKKILTKMKFYRIILLCSTNNIFGSVWKALCLENSLILELSFETFVRNMIVFYTI